MTPVDPAPRRLDGKACCLFGLAFLLAATLFVVVAAATVLVFLWLGGDASRPGDRLARALPPSAATAIPTREASEATPAAEVPAEAATAAIPPPPAAALLDPDVLSAYPDANITPPYQALRLEDEAAARLQYEGARLAIGGLTPTWTLNFGRVAADRPTTRTLTIANVGTRPLVVPRIHHNCACLSVHVGTAAPARDGYLAEPVTLDPGETTTLSIRFDPSIPRANIPGVATAYFAQLFSNDARSEQFVAGDANSHEVRLRIVAMVPAATPTPQRPETS